MIIIKQRAYRDAGKIFLFVFYGIREITFRSFFCWWRAEHSELVSRCSTGTPNSEFLGPVTADAIGFGGQ